VRVPGAMTVVNDAYLTAKALRRKVKRKVFLSYAFFDADGFAHPTGFCILISPLSSIYIFMEKPVSPSREYLNNLSSIILNASISVHREMGPGLLEGVYQQCMAKE